MKDTKLTTVKIIKDIYSKFKRISFDSNITLQKLVNRSLTNILKMKILEHQINNYTQPTTKWFSILIMNKQDNGNTQLNQTREEFNDRVEFVKIFRKYTKSLVGTHHRRFRTI